MQFQLTVSRHQNNNSVVGSFSSRSLKGSSLMSAEVSSRFVSILNRFYGNLRRTFHPRIWMVLVLIQGTFATIDETHAQGPTQLQKKPNPEDTGMRRPDRNAFDASIVGSKATERAIAGGLNWLARHQHPDGSWSFRDHTQLCKDATCTCQGEGFKSTPAATAFALLPFLAAGQTHKQRGPYQKTINDGIQFLVEKVPEDGGLGRGVPASMYSQGIGTIALCQAYAMTKDEALKLPAQRAVDFVCRAQHPELGGWHYYLPGSTPTSGDLSITGWQLSALQSAKQAGLNVPRETLAGAQKFVASCSKGKSRGLGTYMVESGPSPSMTAVSLLCKQFQGAKSSDPASVEAVQYLMQYQPGTTGRNSYYFYYATQALHRAQSKDWVEWRQVMLKYLVDSQQKDGCAEGSWDPENPKPDTWGEEGGRLLITSLSTLTLEIPFARLPLYQLEPDQPAESK